MGSLSSCPSLLDILSLLDYGSLCFCRLVNHRMDDVIRRNHFNRERKRCEKLSIFFCKMSYSGDRVELSIMIDDKNNRKFLILDTHIESELLRDGTAETGHQTTTAVTLAGGIVEGIQRLVPRLATRYQFDKIISYGCPDEDWARSFTELPRFSWLQCDALTVGKGKDNTISNAIAAKSINLHDPIDVEGFVERNESWDRMIYVRSYRSQLRLPFQNIAELIKITTTIRISAEDAELDNIHNHLSRVLTRVKRKWRSGVCDRLLYFYVDTNDPIDPTPYHQVISFLQSIPAFFIGTHVFYSYVKAYFRRVRNIISFEEGTESVLCLEWKMNELLLREVNYSGSFDVLPAEKIKFDGGRLECKSGMGTYKPSRVSM